MSIYTVFGNAIALFILWLFVSAGYSKLLPSHRDYYLQVFRDYGISSQSFAGVLIYSVGAFEVLTGFLVIAPPLRTPGLIIAGLILSSYLLLMAQQLRQGKAQMECGCSGPNSGIQLSPSLLIRNAVLIAILPIATNTGLGWEFQSWLVSIMTAFMLVLTSLSVDQLLRNTQKIKAINAH